MGVIGPVLAMTTGFRRIATTDIPVRQERLPSLDPLRRQDRAFTDAGS